MPRAMRYGTHRVVTRVVGALASVACLACLTLVAGCATNAAGASVGGVSPEPSSAQPSGAKIVVTDASNQKTVNVHVGSQVELLLSSSYWTVNGSSAVKVLRQDGASMVLPRPSNCPPTPGLGCQPLQTDFTAMTVGTAIITANRTSCGEAMRCPPDKEHFLVTIAVQSK